MLGWILQTFFLAFPLDDIPEIIAKQGPRKHQINHTKALKGHLILKFWKVMLNFTSSPSPTFFILPFFGEDCGFGIEEVFQQKRASEKAKKR